MGVFATLGQVNRRFRASEWIVTKRTLVSEGLYLSKRYSWTLQVGCVTFPISSRWYASSRMIWAASFSCFILITVACHSSISTYFTYYVHTHAHYTTCVKLGIMKVGVLLIIVEIFHTTLWEKFSQAQWRHHGSCCKMLLLAWINTRVLACRLSLIFCQR